MRQCGRFLQVENAEELRESGHLSHGATPLWIRNAPSGLLPLVPSTITHIDYDAEVSLVKPGPQWLRDHMAVRMVRCCMGFLHFSTLQDPSAILCSVCAVCLCVHARHTLWLWVLSWTVVGKENSRTVVTTIRVLLQVLRKTCVLVLLCHSSECGCF